MSMFARRNLVFGWGEQTEVDLLAVGVGLPSFGDTCAKRKGISKLVIESFRLGREARIVDGQTHTKNGLLAQTKKNQVIST